MEFGEWLAEIRKRQNLDVRSLAEMTHVDSSTISRTENLRTQVSLFTAFRISEGMDVPLVDLLGILQGRRFSALENSYFIENGNVLTLQTIEKVHDDFFSEDAKRYVQLLASHLNELLKELQHPRRRSYTLLSYNEDDVYKFLYGSPLFYSPEIKYPSTIGKETILYTYERKGALMLQDAELYASNVRPNRSRSRLLPPGTSPTLRIGAVSSVERIKFDDVLQFDIEAGQDGKVVGMYWEACRFHAAFASSSSTSQANLNQAVLFDEPDLNPRFIYHKEWEFNLAIFLTVIYRWYQVLRGNDAVFKLE